MSKGSQEAREWRFHIKDMMEFGEKVLSYTADIDQAAFISDPLTYDATLRNLELIGEAATHIPGEVRNTRPDIPWRSIIGMRNRLIHAYLSIDDDLVWDVIQKEVPELLDALKSLAESSAT